MTKVSLVRRRPLSLNSRVMLFVAMAIGFSLLMIGYPVLNEVERHFAEQDADELVVITRAVEDALQSAKDQDSAPEGALARAVSGHHGVYFQVWDDAGRLVYSLQGRWTFATSKRLFSCEPYSGRQDLHLAN